MYSKPLITGNCFGSRGDDSTVVITEPSERIVHGPVRKGDTSLPSRQCWGAQQSGTELVQPLSWGFTQSGGEGEELEEGQYHGTGDPAPSSPLKQGPVWAHPLLPNT